jgi:hypothetical protein
VKGFSRYYVKTWLEILNTHFPTNIFFEHMLYCKGINNIHYSVTVPATLFLTFLSCFIVRESYRIVRVSYHIVRVSYRIVRVSYRVVYQVFSFLSCFAFIRFSIYREKSFIVWLRSLSGLWIISKEKVRYFPKVLFVLSKNLFLGMFVCLYTVLRPVQEFFTYMETYSWEWKWQ